MVHPCPPLFPVQLVHSSLHNEVGGVASVWSGAALRSLRARLVPGVRQYLRMCGLPSVNVDRSLEPKDVADVSRVS